MHHAHSCRCRARFVALLVTVTAMSTMSFVVRPLSLRCSSSRQHDDASPSSRCINMRSGLPSEVAVGRGLFLTRALAGGAAVVLTTTAYTPREAEAIDLSDLPLPSFGSKAASPEEAMVIEVAQYSQVVTKLAQDLRSGTLKGGAEDSAVVARVLEIYLKPMQETMLEVAPLLQLAKRDRRERARLLPLLMKGHLTELEAACGTKIAKEQLQEVDEVKETLDEFVALAKTRYDIGSTVTAAAPDGDQLGIFGCDFYGMKRTDGTNTCQPDP